MAGAIAEAYVEIKPDTKGFGKALSNDVDGSIDNQSGALSGAGRKAGGLLAAGVIAGTAAAGVAFGAFAAFSVSQASNLNESINAVSVTFGEAGAEILKLGENAATSVGLSNNEFNGLAVQFSSFADKIAGPGGDVVGTIDDITTRAADFASVMNLEVADAATIFQAGLAGETEGLKRFGVDLSDANIKAYAAANGIGTLGEELTEAEKVQARYGSLMEQTNKTQGDFANTSDSMANGLRILKSQVADTAAVFGSAMLPGIGLVVGQFNELVPQLTEPLQELGTSIAETLGPVFEQIGPVVETVLGTLGGLFDNFARIFAVITPLIEPLVDVLGSVAAIIGETLTTALEAAGPAFVVIGGLIKQLQPALIQLTPVIYQLATTIGTILGQAIQIIAPIIEQLLPIFVQIGTIVGGVLNSVLTVLGEVILKLMDALAPLIPVLADAFLTVLEALAPILVQVADMIGLMAGEIIDALVPVLPVLAELLLAVIEAFLPLLPVLVTLLESQLPIFVQLVEQLSPLLVTLTEILTALLVPAIEFVVAAMTFWIENVLIPIYSFIGEQFGPILSGIADIARAVGDAFVAMGGFFLDIWNNNLKPIAEWFSGAFTTAVDGMSPIFDALGVAFGVAKDVMTTVWNDGFKPIYNWFKNTFGDAFDAAGDAVSGLGTMFAVIFSGIGVAVEVAMGIVKSAINLVIRGWNRLEFNIPKVDLGPLGSFGGGEFGTKDIKELANGMIGYTPMIAKLFEDGPEAVIPLSSRRAARADQLMEQSGLADRARANGGKGGMVVQFTGGQTFVDGTDADVVAQKTSAAWTAMAG